MTGLPDRTNRISSVARGTEPSGAIIVPLDGTRAAAAALPVARALARLEDVPLQIVHIAGEALPPQEVQHGLHLLAEELRGVVVEQRTGDAAETIVAQAAASHAAAIVLCSHTKREKAAGALGGVALHVLQHAACPVVLVQPERGSAPWRLRRILLPYDGSPSTAAALGPAVQLAARAGADVTILHVAGPSGEISQEAGSFAFPRFADESYHESQLWRREFVERLRVLCQCPGSVPLRLVFRRGDPGTAVVEAATEEGTNLVILAWRTNLAPKRAKVVRTVVGHAPCPVMLIPLVSPE